MSVVPAEVEMTARAPPPPHSTERRQLHGDPKGGEASAPSPPPQLPDVPSSSAAAQSGVEAPPVAAVGIPVAGVADPPVTGIPMLPGVGPRTTPQGYKIIMWLFGAYLVLLVFLVGFNIGLPPAVACVALLLPSAGFVMWVVRRQAMYLGVGEVVRTYAYGFIMGFVLIIFAQAALAVLLSIVVTFGFHTYSDTKLHPALRVFLAFVASTFV
eukprot:RCo017971